MIKTSRVEKKGTSASCLIPQKTTIITLIKIAENIAYVNNICQNAPRIVITTAKAVRR